MLLRLLLCVLVPLFTNGESCVTTEEHGALMNRVEQLEHMVHQQEDLIHQQRQLIEALTSRSDVLQKPMQESNPIRTRRQVESPVALSATINQLYVDHIGVGQTIVFPDVITNIGANYHSSHGIFTVPRSGLYLVSSSILSGHGTTFSAAIEVNGSQIVRLYEKGADNLHGSSSQTVVLHLNKGDDVGIQSKGNDMTIWGDKYSSFTIVLLSESDINSPVVG